MGRGDVAVILHRASGLPERKHEFIWRLDLDLALGLGLADVAQGLATRRRVEADVAQGLATRRRVEADVAQGLATRRRVKIDVAQGRGGTSPPFSVIPQLGT
jgi:hypothetical protein